MKKVNEFIKLLSLAAACAAVSAPAMAVPPGYGGPGYGYVVDPSVPLWAGPYIGGHIGGVWSDFTNKTPVPGPSGSASSVTGGPQIGFNWQSNRLVYGAEADWSWENLNSHNGGVHFHEAWQSTIRGRLGYAMGPWLPYATGGLALTQTRSETAAGNAENIQPGYAVGGGIEKYISPRFSAKAEYLYTNVPNNTEHIAGVPVEGGSGNNAVRVGFNYHF